MTRVSLSGALSADGPSFSPARALERGAVPEPAPRRRPAPLATVRALGVLLALALGAVALVGFVAPRVPALAAVIGLGPVAPAAPAAPPVTVTAVVAATASCLSPAPYDRVVLDLAGTRRQATLDGCGRAPGMPVAVIAPSDGRITGPLRVAGTGATGTTTTTTDGALVPGAVRAAIVPAAPATPPATSSSGAPGDGTTASPLVGRLELALTVAAALGAGALLVACSRRGTAGAPTRRAPARRPSATGPARRGSPGRPDERPAARRHAGGRGTRPARGATATSSSARSCRPVGRRGPAASARRTAPGRRRR